METPQNEGPSFPFPLAFALSLLSFEAEGEKTHPASSLPPCSSSRHGPPSTVGTSSVLWYVHTCRRVLTLILFLLTCSVTLEELLPFSEHQSHL